jgi:dethiobiotin synthetase
LARHLASEGHRVGVYKPVASGIIPGQASDPEILYTAAGLDCPLERVCPQQFSAALAPPVAARLEDRQVDEQLLRTGADWWQQHCEILIVEGAGGVLAPISESLTVLDLCVELGFPTIVVAANRLGVVNHTLLTLESLSARGLQNLGVVLNTMPNQVAKPGGGDVSLDSNASLLKQFAPAVEIVSSICDLTLPGL